MSATPTVTEDRLKRGLYIKYLLIQKKMKLPKERPTHTPRPCPKEYKVKVVLTLAVARECRWLRALLCAHCTLLTAHWHSLLCRVCPLAAGAIRSEKCVLAFDPMNRSEI